MEEKESHSSDGPRQESAQVVQVDVLTDDTDASGVGHWEIHGHGNLCDTTRTLDCVAKEQLDR